MTDNPDIASARTIACRMKKPALLDVLQGAPGCSARTGHGDDTGQILTHLAQQPVGPGFSVSVRSVQASWRSLDEVLREV